jgi:hypothetical protein
MAMVMIVVVVVVVVVFISRGRHGTGADGISVVTVAVVWSCEPQVGLSPPLPKPAVARAGSVHVPHLAHAPLPAYNNVLGAHNHIQMHTIHAK